MREKTNQAKSKEEKKTNGGLVRRGHCSPRDQKELVSLNRGDSFLESKKVPSRERERKIVKTKEKKRKIKRRGEERVGSQELPHAQIFACMSESRPNLASFFM
jgi:hypothetical protein